MDTTLVKAKSHRLFHYACAASGAICMVLFFIAMLAARFLPPTSPAWTAEETASHYRRHEKGIQAGAALMIISSMFYLPFSAAISFQMRRIPTASPMACNLQLAAGAAAVWTLMLPGIFLAVAVYRLDRFPEITLALNDLFWLTIPLPWPLFMIQDYAFAYAILCDPSPKPLFPKKIAMMNLAAPAIFVPAITAHCFKTGPLAWNGAFTYWLVNFTGGVQITIDSLCLVRAIYLDKDTSGSASNTRSDIDGLNEPKQ
ncbi:hypothetical protein CDD82_6468 [Ophiocordyceps australis]|uniref:Uncharacterized protein n=1 Tax=Ophiocordyceps australis TaxID=1399860 RepID=A0A2C5YW12_9HYPO|nr:hypothetical protein CDD82_6468 [Ophiocordyceps australis]